MDRSAQLLAQTGWGLFAVASPSISRHSTEEAYKLSRSHKLSKVERKRAERTN